MFGLKMEKPHNLHNGLITQLAKRGDLKSEDKAILLLGLGVLAQGIILPNFFFKTSHKESGINIYFYTRSTGEHVFNLLK